MPSWSQRSAEDRASYPQHVPARSALVRPRDNGRMPDASTPTQRFLAPAQVAELLCIEVDEVIELVCAGRLRGSKLGTPARWRVEESSLSEYLAEQSEEARRMALWRQANEASFPEVWGTSHAHGI